MCETTPIRNKRTRRRAIARAATAFAISLLGVPDRSWAQELPRISQEMLFHRLIDLDRLATPPADGERLLLFSSYDRASAVIKNGKYATWDANNDRGQFLRSAGDGWDVLAELEGPGAIVRVWADAPEGDVRIILDGIVAFEGAFKGLFDGAIEPFGKPLSYWMGQTRLPPTTEPTGDERIKAAQRHELTAERHGVCYYPVGFSRSMRVQTRKFTGAYQIDVTAFPPGTQVETSSRELSREAAAELKRVSRRLEGGYGDKLLLEGRKTMAFARNLELKAGEKYVDAVKRSGTIRSFYVALMDSREPPDPYYLRNLILRITWDGRKTPDIECPLTDFFGCGFDRNPNDSLLTGSAKSLDSPAPNQNAEYWYYSYFPMPFSKEFRLEVENGNKQKVGVLIYARIETTPPAADSLRFRARFRAEPLPCTKFDVPLLSASGRGRFVGAVLSVDCPRKAWWGAGDHKFWIDGEAFPSLWGTDTGGYFAVDPDGRADARPLHGSSALTHQGKSSLYRWHLTDAIPFHSSIRGAIENWQDAQATDVYYSAVAFWYGEAGAADEAPRVDAVAVRTPGVRIVGAQEVETSLVGGEGRDWTRLSQAYAGAGVELSAEAAASINSDKPLAFVIHAERAGRYSLAVRTHPQRSFERIEVSSADGKPVGAVEYRRSETGLYTLGEVALEAGENRFTLRCSKKAVLDYWLIEPK